MSISYTNLGNIYAIIWHICQPETLEWNSFYWGMNIRYVLIFMALTFNYFTINP